MDRGHSYRRHLPHYQSANKIYLVTFVTSKRWCLPPAARDIVMTEIANIHYEMAFIHAGTVMPDHVHLVLQPLWSGSGGVFALFEIQKKLKGRSARFINLALERSGTLWLDEHHDHEIRSDDSLIEKIEYVLQNPVRKGLSATPEDYPWNWRWWIEGKKKTG
jgi:REP element-mobilizing transposase RayT